MTQRYGTLKSMINDECRYGRTLSQAQRVAYVNMMRYLIEGTREKFADRRAPWYLRVSVMSHAFSYAYRCGAAA